MRAIEVILGLLSIILLYSLFATVIMEMIAGALSLRARHLKRTLRQLLAGQDRTESLLSRFTDHPLYRQLAGHGLGKNSPPSYLSAPDFRSILISILDPQRGRSRWTPQLGDIPDRRLAELLEQFWDEAGNEKAAFFLRIENWYNDIMDRATGWYKRRIHRILLIVGFAVAVIFNVDLVTVFDRLVNSTDDELARLSLIAQQLPDQSPMLIQINVDSSSAMANPLSSPTANSEAFRYLRDNIEAEADPLGIGWSSPTAYPENPIGWVMKVLGWLLMALCIAKGAPFWFDLLKKVVSFRQTGTLSDTPAPSPVPTEKVVIPALPPPSVDTSPSVPYPGGQTPVG